MGIGESRIRFPAEGVVWPWPKTLDRFTEFLTSIDSILGVSYKSDTDLRVTLFASAKLVAIDLGKLSEPYNPDRRR